MAQLLRAVGNGDLEKVIELRDQWNHQNKKGETALHIAVSEDQLEIVTHLVSNGVMLNVPEKKNQFTPLMLCLAQQPPRYLEILQAILKGKPDLNVQDSIGQTALHLSAQYGLEDAMLAILRARPKVDALDLKKMTALHVACGKGDLDLIKLLIERGNANVNLADGKGNLALHWACIDSADNLAEIVEYLISKGAKGSANQLGNTALHVEAMHCNPDASWPTPVAAILMKEFPGMEKEINKDGLTPQKLFEQGIAEEAQAEESKTTKPSTKKNDEEDQTQIQSAAARAAAIARSKKGKKNTKIQSKTTSSSSSGDKEGGIMTILIILAVIIGFFAALYAFLASSAQ